MGRNSRPQAKKYATGFAPPPYTGERINPVTEALGERFAALFGSTATRLAPTNPRWTTFTGQMSPENIAAAMELANIGKPYRYLDMCRRAIENDAHLGGIIEQRNAAILAKPDRHTPPPMLRTFALAKSVANWNRAVREQVKDYDRVRYGLLLGDGFGFAGAEIIWDYRRLLWVDGDGRRRSGTYLVPVKLELVEPRSFTFDMESDEPLLWQQGGARPLPWGKFVFHVANGHSTIVERNGYMRACLYLHAMKQWTLRDMSIYLHIYGVPQLLAEYNPAQFSYDEARALIRDVLSWYGEGAIPTTQRGGIDVRQVGAPTQWALVHSEAAEFLNREMTKRVALSSLTYEEGGSNYAATNSHAEGAFDGATVRARNLCGTLRRDLYAPCLQMNALLLRGELGAPAEDIMAALSHYDVRMERNIDPKDRQQIMRTAAEDGFRVSQEQYGHDLDLDEAFNDADVLPGKAVSVPSSGAAVGAQAASEGVTAPEPASEQRQLPAHEGGAEL